MTDYAYEITYDCKSHRGYQRMLNELEQIAGASTPSKFWRDGPTYRITNDYGNQHRKIIRFTADSPLLAWAKEKRKRIRKA